MEGEAVIYAGERVPLDWKGRSGDRTHCFPLQRDGHGIQVAVSMVVIAYEWGDT